MEAWNPPASSEAPAGPEPAREPGSARLAGLVRPLLVAHVVALVLVRVLRDADDFVNWDLTGFLNAYSFGSLRALLARPEVHFWNPFSFPQYNVGAESAISAVLYRLLGPLDFYWTGVVVLLLYDAFFLFLLHVFFRRLYHGAFGQNLAWTLLAMSPVILTFMSTSAFNMQGYAVMLLGLIATELVLQRRAIVGLVLLAVAFLLIDQAYPLSYYLPYFLGVWTVYRAIGRPPEGISLGRRLGFGTLNLAAVAGFVWLLNRLSKGVYLLKIRPSDPYTLDSNIPFHLRLAKNLGFFLRQSFYPVQRVDNVPVGFAPYLLYVVLLAVAILALVGIVRRRRVSSASPGHVRALWGLGFDVGLVVFGYFPAFITWIVKSQRALFGDFFLVVVLVSWMLRLVERGRVGRVALSVLLGVLLLASDAYYLRWVLAVDHSHNHMPRFDFDMSDGIARHDLDTAVRMMRRQVEEENAALVVYYARDLTENTTDPGVFFARFLRHYGAYMDRPEVIFPCRWCEVFSCPTCGIRYGCPFPETLGQACGTTCCYTDPVVESSRRESFRGRKLVLWWHQLPPGLYSPDVPGVTLDSVLAGFGQRYRVAPLTLPSVVSDWRVFELSPREAGAP